MSDTLPQRPTFTNGQYIGADDLNAAVDYANDKTERLSLSGRTWGIGSGLALVEIADATGAIQMYIEPGIAWDGYGRAIVVVSPAPVTADLFAGLPSGNQKVWLRYSALDTQMVSPGFQACGAGDPATRIADTYAIVTTALTVLMQTDGVVLNGVAVPDPRNMLIAFDAAAAVVLDGSAPHQFFPDDSAEWLVPVGVVSYNASSASFNARTPAQLALNRVTRRYIGAVVESVLAADGVLRLRDRQTDQQSGQTNDALDAAASIQPSDIQADPNNLTRMIGNELVWVEGNLRVLGDARLWGGALSLRAADGTEPAGSLFLRRNADPSTATVQNLEMSIGQQPSGSAVNRLLVAASTPATGTIPATLVPPPALSVGTDARVGIGVAVPETGLALDINGDFGHDGGPTTIHLNGSSVGDTNGTLLLTASKNIIELGADGVVTHVAIGTNSPQSDTALDVHGGGIAVNKPSGSSAAYTNAFLRLLGSELTDLDDGRLHIRSGGGIVTFDGGDNVGVNTTNPNHRLDVSGDANVSDALTAGSVGIGVSSPSKPLDVSGDAHISGALTAGSASISGDLAVGGGVTLSVDASSHATLGLWGSKVLDDDQGVLHLWSGGYTVLFDGPNNDNVGIGPNPGGTYPAARLDVNGNAYIRGDITYTGTIIHGFSDQRLKRDVRPLEGALDKLLALRGVEFEWAQEDLTRLRPGRQTGLIAQEVERVFPGWVRVDPASGMKLLGPQGFEALVIEALRQLASRIEALEQENQRLARALDASPDAAPETAGADRSEADAPKRRSKRDAAPTTGKTSGG
jgi:hypothetical protein